MFRLAPAAEQQARQRLELELRFLLLLFELRRHFGGCRVDGAEGGTGARRHPG